MTRKNDSLPPSSFWPHCVNFFYEHIWLFMILIVIALITAFTVIPLLYLPGPLFGGDVYRERGFTEHVAQGYSITQDPQISDGVAFRPQLAYVLVAALSGMGFGSIDRIMILLPILIVVLYTIGIYCISREIIKSKFVAISAALLTFATLFIYSVKHTQSLSFVFLLFGVYFLIRSMKTGALHAQILSGVFFGCAAMSHMENMIFISMLVGSFVGFEFIYLIILKKDGFLDHCRLIFMKAWIPTTIFLVMSSFYFAPIIFQGKAHVLNQVTQYGLTDISLYGISDVLSAAFGPFIGFSSIPAAILSVIRIAGLLYVITKLKSAIARFSSFVFIGAFFTCGHFLITRPLFDFWITPSNLFVFFSYAAIPFMIFGLAVMYSYLKQYTYYVLAIILIIVCLQTYSSVTGFVESPWTKPNFSPQPLLDQMYGMRDWILHNTTRDAIFLSNDESAFALNALTARKVVMTRRIHASQFVDINQRYADGLVMLYGHNENVTRALISKYNVTHVYIDRFLMQYPMLTDAKYAQYLTENGVNVTVALSRWDPSTSDARQLESAIVFPQNITLFSLVNYSNVYQDDSGAILRIE